MRWVLIVLLGLLAGLQYRLWIGPGSWEQITELKRGLAEQVVHNERLIERNQRLETEIFNLKNGTESIEEQARSELGLIKEGETFYLLIDDKK